MPTCEYCGEDFTKGGAYATHVRYCDARPDEGEPAQHNGEDVDSTEDESPQSGGEVAVEITDDADAAQGRSANTESETGNIRDGPATDEPTPARGHTVADDGSARRWIAVVGLILFVLLLWKLRSSNDP